MKEQLKLTAEEAREIIWGDSDEFKVVSDTITGLSRWSVKHKLIIQRLSDNKFFASNYSRGATEIQDEQPYEYGDPVFEEVFPVEKNIIVYE